jgi:hypothetical protein
MVVERPVSVFGARNQGSKPLNATMGAHLPHRNPLFKWHPLTDEWRDVTILMAGIQPDGCDYTVVPVRKFLGRVVEATQTPEGTLLTMDLFEAPEVSAVHI